MIDWVEIYDGTYAVSNLGVVCRNKPGKATYVGRICTEHITEKGYVRVSICGHGLPYLHKLVADAFLGRCPRGKEANHKDGNKRNNRVGNLEYLTHKRNIRHAVEHGLYAQRNQSGSSNPFAKLTEEKVRFIRRSVATKSETQATLARMFDVTPDCIYKITSRQYWKHC